MRIRNKPSEPVGIQEEEVVYSANEINMKLKDFLSELKIVTDGIPEDELLIKLKQGWWDDSDSESAQVVVSRIYFKEPTMEDWSLYYKKMDAYNKWLVDNKDKIEQAKLKQKNAYKKSLETQLAKIKKEEERLAKLLNK
jgi:hypothetical protein